MINKDFEPTGIVIPFPDAVLNVNVRLLDPLVVASSIITTLSVESGNVTVLLAANVPVITTPVGGNLEVINDGDNGFVHKEKDIKMLSSITFK